MLKAKMKSLSDWLEHIEALHSKPIDLGLERMQEMLKRLGLSFHCPTILVGGTNGKGSTCAYLESIYQAQGYRVGLHTSPHLIRFNERARFNGQFLTDDQLCETFEEVEKARKGMTLSYFEFTLLGILLCFQKLSPDVLVLEIGLGGRLDAVNTIEPDVSIVTNVALDHMAYLGNTIEEIGWEKAFIYRPNKPAIFVERHPPVSLQNYAKEIKAHLMVLGKDFEYRIFEDHEHWEFVGQKGSHQDLPLPTMLGEHQITNASGSLAAIEQLQNRLPVTENSIKEGLVKAKMPGRFQRISNDPEIIIDVGHNPHAASQLVQTMKLLGNAGTKIAVFGMLKDKDRQTVCDLLADSFDCWCVSDLQGERGGRAEELETCLVKAGVESNKITKFSSVADAIEKAKERVKAPDKIIIFGSFVTVADAMQYFHLQPA